MRGLAVVAVVALVEVACASPPTPSRSSDPHVFIIVMENHSADQALSGAFTASLAATYGMAENYHAITHPSLPNYLAITSGSTWGVGDDSYHVLPSGKDLGAQLTRAGLKWRAYMEGMTDAGCIDSPLPYDPDHNPFAFYGGACPPNVVTLTELSADLAGDTPRFVWITPDRCHDTHDCEVSEGDDWLRGQVGEILASKAWKSGGVRPARGRRSEAHGGGELCSPQAGAADGRRRTGDGGAASQAGHRLRGPAPQREGLRARGGGRRRRGALRLRGHGRVRTPQPERDHGRGPQDGAGAGGPRAERPGAGHRDRQRRVRMPVRGTRAAGARAEDRRAPDERASGRGVPRGHDRRGSPCPGARARARRAGFRRHRRRALPQHAQHGLRERAGGAGGGSRLAGRFGRRSGRLPVRSERHGQHRHRGPGLSVAGYGSRNGDRPGRAHRHLTVAGHPARQGPAGDARAGGRLPGPGRLQAVEGAELLLHVGDPRRRGARVAGRALEQLVGGELAAVAVDVLAEPVQEIRELTPLDLGVEVGDVEADLLHQLGADQVPDRVAGEDAEAHEGPVDVLECAVAVVRHVEPEIGLEARVPRLGKVFDLELALEQLVLQLEAEEDVQVVGDLVRLDADVSRM